MAELRCRVCAAGPSGQRLHKCPNSKYYIRGSDPSAEMLVPQRIQRKRTKGWRMPEGAIYVGRPTRWGNPFIIGQSIVPPINRYQPRPIYVRDANHATLLYSIWLKTSAVRVEDIVPLLSGHDLACWCPLDSPCHADVLLELCREVD